MFKAGPSMAVWARKLCPPLSTLRADAAMTIALVALAGAWVRVAEAPGADGARSPAADAIAERFAGPALDSSNTLAAANLDARLNFVPREFMLRAAPALNAVPLTTIAKSEAQTQVQGSGVEDLTGAAPLPSLAVVIFRNLPEGSGLSAGARLSATSWAVAEGDLNTLAITLAGAADKPVMAELEVISPSGFSSGILHVEIRRDANGGVARIAADGVRTGAISQTAKLVAPEVDDHSKIRPKLHRTSVKRKAKTHSAERQSHAVRAARRVATKPAAPTQDQSNSKPATGAEQPGQALFPSPNAPPASVLTGIGKLISDLLPGQPGTSSAASFAPAGE